MWLLFVSGMALAVGAGAVVDPTQVPWRVVEVGSISFVSVAIISAIAEWRRMRPTNELPSLRNRVSSSLIALGSVAPTYLR